MDSNCSDPHLIFSVPIWGYVLNRENYHLKDYVEYILELEQNELSVTKSNFGGYQSRDNLNEEPIFQELVESITAAAQDSLSDKFKVIELWANINRYKDSNGAHTHGGYISGVFYLMTPENCGNLILCNPNVRADVTKFKINNYCIKPQPLACIIFPSWLEHYVEPNMSQKPRISMSFNIEKII
jgi:uncharacterized protein (TIGR02466 family)